MSAEWIQRPLGDVITLQRGHDLPSQDRNNGTIPIMGSSGLTGYHDQPKAPGPGVVVGRSGNSMGEVSFCPTDYWPLNTALYVTDFKGNDERFIYYLLKTIDFDQFNSGSAQKSLNRNAVYPYEVNLPKSVEEQKRISSILACLEAKLELNNNINQTLEQMAQVIFKSWFVNFEPVKAKINALEAGGSAADAELAAMQAISGKNSAQLEQMTNEQPEKYAKLRATTELFPSEMQESELGAIPGGWECVHIGDITQRLKTSKRYTKKQVSQYGNIPVFEQGAGILLGFHNDEPGFKANAEDPVFIFGDHTCITHLSCQKFDISQNVIPLKGSIRPTVWTYYAILGKQTFQEYRRHWSEFAIKLVVLPPQELCQVFADVVTDGLLLTESLGRECKELESIRDSLLSKLLSGELSTSEEAHGDSLK